MHIFENARHPGGLLSSALVVIARAIILWNVIDVVDLTSGSLGVPTASVFGRFFVQESCGVLCSAVL